MPRRYTLQQELDARARRIAELQAGERDAARRRESEARLSARSREEAASDLFWRGVAAMLDAEPERRRERADADDFDAITGALDELGAVQAERRLDALRDAAGWPEAPDGR